MATTMTSLYPAEASEPVMRRIPRVEWMEWFAELAIHGPIDLMPIERSNSCADPGTPWRLERADYDAFDDVLELVLSDQTGSLRLLVDGPSEVLAAGTSAETHHVTIIAPDGPVIIRSVEAAARLRAG